MTASRPCLQRDPSHAYPTATGIWPPLVASGCLGWKQVRGTGAPLSWCFVLWQVLGSNQRRLSRRFYSWAHRGWSRSREIFGPCGRAAG
jgi:hypothetical protein